MFHEAGCSRTLIQLVWGLFLKDRRGGLRVFTLPHWRCPHTVHRTGQILLLSVAGLQPWALGHDHPLRGGSGPHLVAGAGTGGSVGKEPGTAPGAGPQLCEAGCSVLSQDHPVGITSRLAPRL